MILVISCTVPHWLWTYGYLDFHHYLAREGCVILGRILPFSSVFYDFDLLSHFDTFQDIYMTEFGSIP